jgi:hypothetical protein
MLMRWECDEFIDMVRERQPSQAGQVKIAAARNCDVEGRASNAGRR